MTLCSTGLLERPAVAQPAGGNSVDAAAINQFDAAIAKYLALRKKSLGEVPGPRPGVDGAEAHTGQ
jgi:hypothetical protein